jgi:hypothetical protein
VLNCAMHKSDQEKKQKLLQLVRDAIAKDEALRDQYGIGNKFRFIREKLNTLSAFIDTEITSTMQLEEDKQLAVQEDETVIYVYLFNSQGVSLATWRKMLHTSVFYEYSINRPIYLQRSQIDSLIRGRSNKLQHGYLSVIVKKIDILDSQSLNDSNGNQLAKVKEGSLKRERLLAFTHGEHDYLITPEGELVKKEE